MLGLKLIRVCKRCPRSVIWPANSQEWFQRRHIRATLNVISSCVIFVQKPVETIKRKAMFQIDISRCCRSFFVHPTAYSYRRTVVMWKDFLWDFTCMNCRPRSMPTWRAVVKSTLDKIDCYTVQALSWWHHQWKHFPRYWPFVRGIHRSPVNSQHKGQWRGALMFSLIWAWTDSYTINGDVGDLRRYRAHYDVIVMVAAGSQMGVW